MVQNSKIVNAEIEKDERHKIMFNLSQAVSNERWNSALLKEDKKQSFSGRFYKIKHRKEHRRNTTEAIMASQRSKAGDVFLREHCQYNTNIQGVGKIFIYAIWASLSQLSRLRSSCHWYIDETFRICPVPFNQFLIIIRRHGISNTPSPCCYILTSSKTAKKAIDRIASTCWAKNPLTRRESISKDLVYVQRVWTRFVSNKMLKVS